MVFGLLEELAQCLRPLKRHVVIVQMLSSIPKVYQLRVYYTVGITTACLIKVHESTETCVLNLIEVHSLLFENVKKGSASRLLVKHSVEVLLVLTVVRFSHFNNLRRPEVAVTGVDAQVVVVLGLLLNDLAQILIPKLIVANDNVARTDTAVLV